MALRILRILALVWLALPWFMSACTLMTKGSFRAGAATFCIAMACMLFAAVGIARR